MKMQQINENVIPKQSSQYNSSEDLLFLYNEDHFQQRAIEAGQNLAQLILEANIIDDPQVREYLIKSEKKYMMKMTTGEGTKMTFKDWMQYHGTRTCVTSDSPYQIFNKREKFFKTEFLPKQVKQSAKLIYDDYSIFDLPFMEKPMLLDDKDPRLFRTTIRSRVRAQQYAIYLSEVSTILQSESFELLGEIDEKTYATYWLWQFISMTNNAVYYRGDTGSQYLATFGNYGFIIPIGDIQANTTHINRFIKRYENPDYPYDKCVRSAFIYHGELIDCKDKPWTQQYDDTYTDTHDVDNYKEIKFRIFRYLKSTNCKLIMKNCMRATKQKEHIEPSGSTVGVYIMNGNNYMRFVEKNDLLQTYPVTHAMIDITGMKGTVYLTRPISQDECGQLQREVIRTVISDKEARIITRNNWTDHTEIINFNWRYPNIVPSGSKEIDDLISQLDECRNKKQESVVKFIRKAQQHGKSKQSINNDKKLIKRTIILQDKRDHKLQQRITPSGVFIDEDTGETRFSKESFSDSDNEYPPSYDSASDSNMSFTDLLDIVSENIQAMEFSRFIDDTMLFIIIKDIFQIIVYGEVRDYLNFVLNLLGQFKFSPVKILKDVVTVLTQQSKKLGSMFKNLFSNLRTEESQQPHPPTSRIVPSGFSYEDMIPIIGSILGVGALGIAMSSVKETMKEDDKIPFLTRVTKKFIFLGKFKHGLYSTIDLLKDFGEMIKSCLKYVCSTNKVETYLDDYFKNMELSEELKVYTKNIFQYIRDYTDISKFPEYEQDQTRVVKILRDLTHILNKAMLLNANTKQAVLKSQHLDLIKCALRDIREMLRKFEEHPLYKPFRKTPHWNYFWGPAGAGKSAFLSWFSTALYNVLTQLEETKYGTGYFQLHSKDNFFYAKNSADAFYSGYKQQDVICIDDVFQDVEGSTPDNTRLAIINLISNILYIPNMPSLNDKGKNMEPKLFVTTSNVFGTGCSSNSIVKEEALLSRRNIVVYMEPGDEIDPLYKHKINFYLHTDPLKQPKGDLRTNKINAENLLSFIVTDYIRHWEEQLAIEKSRDMSYDSTKQVANNVSKILNKQSDYIKNRPQTRNTTAFQEHLYQQFNTETIKVDIPKEKMETSGLPFIEDAIQNPYTKDDAIPPNSGVTDNSLYGWYHQLRTKGISWEMCKQFVLGASLYATIGAYFGFIPAAFSMNFVNKIANFIRGEKEMDSYLVQCVRSGTHPDAGNQRYPWHSICDKVMNFNLNFSKILYSYIKEQYKPYIKFLFYVLSFIFSSIIIYKIYKNYTNNYLDGEISGRYDYSTKRVAKNNIVISGVSAQTETTLNTLFNKGAQVTVQGALSMNAVRLSGKYLLIPYHFFVACKASNVGIFKIKSLINNGFYVKEEVINENNIKRWKHSDICVYKLSKTHPDAKSIVHLFAPESHVISELTEAVGTYSYPRIERVSGFNVSTLTKECNYTDEAVETEEYQHSMIYVSQGYAVKGQSGGLLFAANSKSNFPLLGMQTAICVNSKKSYFVPISQSMLRELMEEKIETSGVYDYEWIYENVVDYVSADMNDGNEHALIYLGETKKEYTVTQSPHTSYEKSIGYDEFVKDTVKEPAVLSCKDPRLGAEVFGQDLIARGMKGFDEIMGCVDQTILQLCVNEISDYYIRSTNLAYSPRRVLFQQEAHNGDGNLILPMELSTSAGLPYCKMPEADGKRMLYDVEGNGVDRQVLYPKYTFDYDIYELEQKMTQGYTCSIPAYACLKDECLKKEKIVKGKTRLFYTLPAHFNVLCRKYTGSFFANVQSRAGEDYISVGIDPVKDFSYMAHRLRKFGDNNLWDFDYGEWDKRLCGDFILGGMEVLNNWYKKYDQSWRHEDDIIRDNIANYLVNTPIIFRDKLFMKTGGMVSGCAITASMNSLAHLVFLFYIWKKFWITRDINKMSFEYFKDNVTAYMYGDDFVGAISNDAKEFMCEETILLIEDLNMNVTTGAKDRDFGLKNYKNIEFLKRRFEQHPIDATKMRAPLHEVSIYNPLVWVHRKDDPFEAFVENARGSLREMALHGKKKYESLKSRIYNVIDDWRKQTPRYRDVIVQFPEYETLQLEIFGILTDI